MIKKLKTLFLNLRFQHKISVILISIIGTVTIILSIYLGINQKKIYMKNLIEKMETVAKMLSYNISPAISFMDVNALKEIFGSIKEVKEIENIIVYNSDGTVFGKYKETPEKYKFIPKLEAEKYTKEKGNLYLYYPITSQGIIQGELLMEISLQGVKKQLTAVYILVGILFVIMVTGALGILIIIDIFITRPLKKQVKTIEEQVRIINDTSATITSATTELQSANTEMKSNIESQRNQVSDVTTSTTELTASIMEVAENAKKVSDSAEKSKVFINEGYKQIEYAISKIKESREQIKNTISRLFELRENANRINEILDIIAKIAEKSDLLALNAAVEASGAGEAGRRFRVVADEMRRLADNSIKSSKEIENILKSIQTGVVSNVETINSILNSINDVAGGVEKSGEILANTVKVFTETSDMMKVVSLATEQQVKATELVNETMNEISKAAEHNVVAINQSVGAINQFLELANKLNKIVAELNVVVKINV